MRQINKNNFIMSKRLKDKIQNSKIYTINWLSLTHNNDLSHEKMWNEKVQQAKHIQQQKQIDRILFGIVKQRLFGQLLSHDTRISDQGYYAMDKLNKQLFNYTQKNSRKISPLPNQPTYELGRKSRVKHHTIDASNISNSRQSKSIHRSFNIENVQINDTKKLKSKNALENSGGGGMQRTRKFFYLPKQLSASKLPNLSNYFRQLTSNTTSMLYDVKLTKEMIVKYNKQKQILTPRYLQKFLYFFNFPGAVNLKQYSNWLQYAFNCTLNQSNFFVFQALDESRNGYLTVSDLFNALHDFPLSSSSFVQKQIYDLMQKIKNLTQLAKNSEVKEQKPTNEQIIVRNHSLRIQEMRQLVKQASKQLISTSVFKSTSYHKSMYALEHSAAAREKNIHLQYSEGGDVLHDRSKYLKKQDGIKFGQFSAMFTTHRSQFFILIGKVLLGEDFVFLQ